MRTKLYALTDEQAGALHKVAAMEAEIRDGEPIANVYDSAAKSLQKPIDNSEAER